MDDDETLIGRATVFVDHGLLLIEDPKSTDLHEDWVPATQYVSAGPSSVYVAVQPSVDGPVEIGMFAELFDDTDAVTGFDGTITSDSGSIVVHDVNDTFRFAIRVPRSQVRLRVLVDEAGSAAEVTIMVILEQREDPWTLG